MDEAAKTEARNYLSTAGFFLLAAAFLLNILTKIDGSSSFIEINNMTTLVIGIGLLIAATLLIILRKRDSIAILFFMIGFFNLFGACVSHSHGTWYTVLMGFLVLLALITLTSKEKVKWLLFLIPLIWFVMGLIKSCSGYNFGVHIAFNGILAVLCFYYAFCCASERISLPGRKLLTADEPTDFKASGAVLGYMLFALITGGYALHYILGEAALPLESFVTLELIAGSLMIFVAILLLAVGKMQFTPVMFLLMALTNILGMYCSGAMWTGIGILFIIIGLFAMLRKESRILPGIMLILYGCTCFFTAYATGTMISAPVVSVILNAIPCLIAIYLSFVAYSQRKLPKF